MLEYAVLFFTRAYAGGVNSITCTPKAQFERANFADAAYLAYTN